MQILLCKLQPGLPETELCKGGGVFLQERPLAVLRDCRIQTDLLALVLCRPESWDHLVFTHQRTPLKMGPSRWPYS